MLNKLFSGGASDLVKNVGGVIDNLHTSKEEKLAGIELAVRNDDELAKHMLNTTLLGAGVTPYLDSRLLRKTRTKKGNITYRDGHRAR